MSGSSRSLTDYIERWGPLLCGAAGFGLLVWFRPSVLAYIVAKDLSISNLYTAIFDWSAIQTGCLFAIYGFVAGKTDGFIGAIRQSRAMNTYIRYVKRAMIMGFVLTILSMPLMVYNYEVTAQAYWWYFIVAFWFSLFIWAFLSFIRVAYIFGVLIRVKEPDSLSGG